MLNTRNVVAGLSIVLLCWLGLYTHKDKWDKIEYGTSVSDDEQSIEVRVERAVNVPLVKESKKLSPHDRNYLKRFGMDKLSRVYKPIFTEQEKIQVMEALKLLTDALDKASIGYFLYGGSLIGSWRHHDIVPWDDDLDIIVNISSWEAIEKIKIPGHILNIQTLNRYKFYSENATDIPGFFWKWPYIDICFFGDNGTHLYDMDPTFSRIFVFDKQDILPLVRRPFGSLSLKTPQNTYKVLHKNYNIDNCKTRSYNHQKQAVIAPTSVKTVDCSILRRLYPFVLRESTEPSIILGGNNIEKIYLDGKLIRTVDLAEHT